MARRIPMFDNVILKKANILFGLAIVENAYDETGGGHPRRNGPGEPPGCQKRRDSSGDSFRSDRSYEENAGTAFDFDTPIEKEYTLYARYEDAPKIHTVTFSGQWKIKGSDDSAVFDFTKANIDDILILVSIFTAAYTVQFVYQYNEPVSILTNTALGYSNGARQFLGWSTSQSASPPNPVWNPGTTFNIKGNVDLYGVWRSNSGGTITTPSPSPSEDVEPSPHGLTRAEGADRQRRPGAQQALQRAVSLSLSYDEAGSSSRRTTGPSPQISPTIVWAPPAAGSKPSSFPYSGTIAAPSSREIRTSM